MLKIATTLADMAELEQRKAMTIDEKIHDRSAGQQALMLSERERHVARSSAFLEASRLVLEAARADQSGI